MSSALKRKPKVIQRVVSDEEFDRHVETIKTHPTVDPIQALAEAGAHYMALNPSLSAGLPFIAAATDVKPSLQGVLSLLESIKK